MVLIFWRDARWLMGLAALVLACGGGGGSEETQPPMSGGAGGNGAGPGEGRGGTAGQAPGGGAGSGGTTPEGRVEFVVGVDVTTLAGSSEPGNVDGSAEQARFNNPVNVAIAASGDIYACDFDNSLVRRISPNGQVDTVFNDPRMLRPFGIIVGPAGELYVQADGNTQRQVETTTGSLWRIDAAAGTGEVLIENVGRPRGMALRPDGQLLLVDMPTHVLRLLDPVTKQLSSFAGKAGEEGYVDGDADAARFRHPYGAAWLPSGELVVADLENHAVRVVDAQGDVTTLAGTGSAGMVDGNASIAQFNQPKDVAVDQDGAVYVSDTGNHRIRVITPDGMVKTVAGDGVAGHHNGLGAEARFFGQEGLDVTADGTSVVVADGNGGEPLPYNRIRVLSLGP